MVKCANFVCINEGRIGKPIKYRFCLSCIRKHQPYVFECDICKNIFTSEIKNGKLPKTCGIKCKNIRRYRIYGKTWRKEHPIIYKPVPKVDKTCRMCAKHFMGFEKNRLYCSVKCGQAYYRKYNKLIKYYKLITERQKQYLHLLKPQEVLYVPQR